MNPIKTRLISAGRNLTKRHWSITHSHSMHEWVLITAGCEQVTVDGVKFEAKVGEVLYFPPNLVHTEQSVGAKPAENQVIQFEYAGDTRTWPRRILDVRGRMRPLAAWLFEGRDVRRPEEEVANQAFFRAVLAEFMRLILDHEDDRVHAVRDLIRENLTGPMGVDRLAQEVGMSKYHFIRWYKKMTGLTPMADVRTIRAGRARDLLMSGNLPIKAVAEEVGLGDAMALSRLFRRQFQMTPGQFRSGGD